MMRTFTPTRRHAAWFVIGCAGMALLMSVLYINLQAAHTTDAIRSTQQTNTAINVNQTRLLRQITRVSKRIRSCTTPGQPCFTDAQKRTGDAVASINRVVILAAACAVGQTGTVPEIKSAIQTCVINGLANGD
jgi:uncharacterized Ntn-hydrolase superfamily protein